MEIHQETGEALDHNVDDQERNKLRLKERIAMLEDSLNPCPLFSKPLSIVHLVEDSSGKPKNMIKSLVYC